MKLATKLIILFLLLTTIPLAIVGYLAYDNGRRTIQQNVLNHLTSTNVLKEDEFDQWVKDNERRLRSLAGQPFFKDRFAAEIAAHDPGNPEYQEVHRAIREDRLLPALEEGGFIELFILRASDGLILVSTDEKEEGKYKESEPYFVEGKSRTYVQNVYYSLTLGEAAMTIGTPIKDREGNLLAVLAGHLDLGEMSKIMEQRGGLSQTEDTYLVNSFNFFVTEPMFGEGYALKKAVRTDGVRACLEHNEGIGFYDDYRGVPVIGAFRWMPERELCILTEVNQAEAYAPIVALRNTLLGIGVGMALIVALLGVLFARTITGPLRQLVEGAEEIGRGNLDYRIAVRGRDEIGQLSQAFNQMTENLQAITASRDELDREIAERKRAEEALRESEVRFSTVFHTSPIGISITRLADGQYIDVNEAFLGLFGYAREEALSHTSLQLQTWAFPEDRGRAVKMLREQGRVRGMEGQFRKKSGEIWTGLFSAKVMDIASDSYVLVLLQDITERKRAEEARVKAVSAVVDAMGDALVLHTLDGEITFVNPAYEELTGYDRRELVGRDAAEVGAEVTKPEDVEITAASIEAALKGEVPVPVPITLISKEGREVPVAFTVSFMRDARGQPSTAVVVFKDITQIKRTEDELKQTLADLEASRAAALNMMADAEEARRMTERANEELRREIEERKRVEAELERSNRELEQFAYVASHDLQEPLRKVQVFGDRLKARQAQAFDEQGRDYLERMQDAARRMQRMINDLLTFSRVATRAQPFVLVDLGQVAQEALSDLELQIEQTDGRIVIGDLPTIEADPSQMRQLLENLIGNGLKFHREGVPPLVEVTSERIKRRGRELCQVLVKDNGIGFDEKYLDRLFKPFQRLHGRGEYAGTGIGLAICRRIAERHGGSITAQSAPGEGATFIVTLPVQQKREA
jgi:PAS domain S-box-containing protein